MSEDSMDRNALDAAFARLSAVIERRRAQEALARGRQPPDSLRRRLEQHERFLARHQSLAGALLRSVHGDGALAPPPMQNALALCGPPGERAVGRFRLVNGEAVSRTARFLLGVCEDGRPPPPVTFDPPTAELPSGARLRVRIAVDLSSLAAGEHFEFPVEVATEGTLSELVWVSVDVR